MKRLSLFLLAFVLVTSAYGQSTEYSVHLNSGLFSFGGSSSVRSSFINVSDVSTVGNYTNNPYGSGMALSYGLAAQVQRVTSSHAIFGIQMGYELLKSSESITSVYEYSPTPIPAHGQTTLNNRLIDIYPNVGHRFAIDGLGIDLTAGPEVGFDLSSWEKGKVTADNATITTYRKLEHPGLDFRLRSSLTVYYNNWGISAGYSYGLRNYAPAMIGAKRGQNYARLIRFGIVYKIH